MQRLIHGGAQGVDTQAAAIARDLGWGEWGVPISQGAWERHGNSAGYRRNRLMLEMCQPDVVLAFPSPNGSGTQNCIAQARALGLDVRVVERT